jgi:hypothetical protein
VGESFPELAEKAKKGLGEIEKAQKEALKKIEELRAAGKKEELDAYCKQAVKEFAKTPVADKAKEVLRELSKSSRLPKAEPEEKKPKQNDQKREPKKETSADLLVKANRCIENEAYEAARRYLEKIIRDYPDSSEATEARTLLESIEDEL